MEDITLDLMAEGGESSFHLPNAPGEEFRRVFIQTPNESSPLNMTIKLVEVHHGAMVFEEDGYQATLLVFEFRFESRLQKRRYQSAQVTLEFFDKGGIVKRDPIVSKVAPDGMHWLQKTAFDKTTKYGTSAGLKAGNDMAGANADAHWDVEYTKPAKYKATLSGKATYSKGKYGNENAARWTMEENTDEEDGIPSFLQVAVLLRRTHSGPFFAKLRVRSEVDLVSATRRSLPVTTDRDKVIDPVTFTPGKVQVRNNSATGIQEGELRNMEKLPVATYFRVSLSKEDQLTPPNDSIPTAPPLPAAQLTSNMDRDAVNVAALATPLPPVELQGTAGQAAPAAIPPPVVESPEGAHLPGKLESPPLPLQANPTQATRAVTEGMRTANPGAVATAMEAVRAAEEAAKSAAQSAARAAEAAAKATDAVKAAVVMLEALTALAVQPA